MRYIIDGYNVIFSGGMASRHCGPNELDSARRQLVRIAAQLKRKTRARITVFFDGGPEGTARGQQHTEKGVRIVQSGSGSTADDQIAEHLRGTTGTRTLVVVSNDNAVKRAARRARARSMSVEDFLKEASRALSSSRAKREPPVKYQGISEHEVKWWKDYFNITENEQEL